MKRDRDIINNRECLEHLDTFEDFPIFFGTTEEPESSDLFTKMTWDISVDTGMIQLRSLVDLTALYQHQTTTAAIGDTWEQHHLEFGKFINSRKNSISVLEIGGAHGILAKNCMESDPQINWLIVEPNPTPVPGCEALIIKDFYPTKKIQLNTYKTIVHSHVLEHMYDPMKFLNDIFENCLHNTQMIFSVPNLKVWMEHKYLNALNFEHTYFAREEYIDWMLLNSGFEILEKVYYGDGHSIFYNTTKKYPIKTDLPNFYYENKEIWTSFKSYYANEINSLGEKLCVSKTNYLFGAHIFSQYLINMGLDQKLFMGVLDNDPNKQNRRLYGTGLLVFSPEALRDVKDVTIVLFAGKYTNEITAQIRTLNQDADIIIGDAS